MKVVNIFLMIPPPLQAGDSAAGTQALPVEKIIDDKICRKDN